MNPLRDGLQSPSVRDPSIEEKIQILHSMESLGIIRSTSGCPVPGLALRRIAKRWPTR